MGFSLKAVGHFKRGNMGTLGASSLVSPQTFSHPGLCPLLIQLQMDLRGSSIGWLVYLFGNSSCQDGRYLSLRYENEGRDHKGSVWLRETTQPQLPIPSGALCNLSSSKQTPSTQPSPGQHYYIVEPNLGD